MGLKKWWKKEAAPAINDLGQDIKNVGDDINALVTGKKKKEKDTSPEPEQPSLAEPIPTPEEPQIPDLITDAQKQAQMDLEKKRKAQIGAMVGPRARSTLLRTRRPAPSILSGGGA